MPSVRLIAASAGLLVVATGGALVAAQVAGPVENGAVRPGAGQGPTDTVGSGGAAHRSGGGDAPAAGHASVGAETSSADPDGAAGAAGAAGPATAGGGTEIENTDGDESSHTGAQMGRMLQKLAHQQSLTGVEAPDRAASRNGGVVAGWPHRVVPAMPGTTRLSTSVAPGGDRLQASLAGRLGGGQSSTVLSFYRSRLTRLGFDAVDSPAVAGSTALGFVRGESHVVVTATVGRPTSYSVYAVLAVDGT